ncbi:MAG: alpha-E domain-containing protein [Acidimicrobiia bacterium]
MTPAEARIPLLSRVAEHLYWGARYLERAVGAARILRAYSETIVDLPTSVVASWEPLLAVAGSREAFDRAHETPDETSIMEFLVADEGNQGSVVASVVQARANFRTVREVIPETMWRVVNDLHLYVTSDRSDGVRRRSRHRFFDRIVADCERLDGVRTSTMLRDEAYEFVRLGQAIERADMTTRVLGVRAADLLTGNRPRATYDDVQWMGVLRSLAAFQAFQRSTRSPIAPDAVVSFVLHDQTFPRSVAANLRRITQAAQSLPAAPAVLAEAERAEVGLAALSLDSLDGISLDKAMDRAQLALASIHGQIAAAYFLDGE